MIPPPRPGGNILLICPQFFDYQQRIAGVFKRLGFQVTIVDDRPSQTAVYKIALRLAPAATARLTRGLMTRHLATVVDQHFDHVVVVKGEAVSRDVISLLRRRFPKARFSLYLWDAVANNRNSAEAARLYDAVATFDPDDARAHGWSYRPLFAADRQSEQSVDKTYDWSFIGTMHSDRMAVLGRLTTLLGESNAFVFGFYASKAQALWGTIRGWFGSKPKFGTFSTQPMSSAATREVVNRSRTIVDIEHPQQVGLTIRTIETILSNRKLITTNKFIQNSALYHLSRVCLIDRLAPRVDDEFLRSEFCPVPANVRYAYSDECWARQIIGLPAAFGTPF